MHRGASSNNGGRSPLIFRRCHFGHLVRVHPDDEKIDITLCAVCLKRSIVARKALGEAVPAEMIEVATIAERWR
jgi:hypothetical protein